MREFLINVFGSSFTNFSKHPHEQKKKKISYLIHIEETPTASLQLYWLIPIKQSCGWSSCDASTKLTVKLCIFFGIDDVLLAAPLCRYVIKSLAQTSPIIPNGQKIINTYWSIPSSSLTITASLPLAWVRLFILHSAHVHTHICTHSAAHNYLFKHSTGYFFGIFSKCTVPMALQTMCRSTFAILQFKTMQALPEQNTEEQREAFQPAALTYRKPLSHLAFAANRKASESVCVSARVCTCMHISIWLHVSTLLVSVNCFHACMCVRTCKYIHLHECALCVSSLVHMNDTDAMYAVCVPVQIICVCVSPSPTFQIRGLRNGSTKVRVFQWLGCNSRLCLKGHHATPLHYLPAISYEFVCLIDF